MQTSRDEKSPPAAMRPMPPVHTPSLPSVSSTAQIQQAMTKKARKHRTQENLVATNEGMPEKCKTFHVVERGRYKDEDRFIKYNPNPNSVMSQVEAGILEVYKLQIPFNVPGDVNVHVDEKGDTSCLSIRGIQNFVSLRKRPLTKVDLENPKIISSLIACAVASFFNCEDDLTVFNIGLSGTDPDNLDTVVRIDVDMSYYPIVGNIKPVWKTIRPILEDSFKFTPYRVKNFPDLQDPDPTAEQLPTPFFCLTSQPYKYLVANTIQKIFSENAFTPDENEQFKQLKDHPVTIYTKYLRMMKIIFINDATYRNALAKHIDSNLTYVDDKTGETTLLIDKILSVIQERKQQLRNVLVNLQEFQTFITSNEGYRAYLEICEEITVQNTITEASEMQKWKKDPSRSPADLLTDTIYLDDIKAAWRSLTDDIILCAVEDMRKTQLVNQRP